MRASTFISYESTDKALAWPGPFPATPLRTDGRGNTKKSRTQRPVGEAWPEQDIIAAGLMRRHNCTIIDDRFIRRPGPGLELGIRRGVGTQRTPLQR
ncbi:hypothetical protein KM043_013309 [Ampulex compressa]|nr:hypothetical protein KM043_013309 [Ampulex compressa]